MMRCPAAVSRFAWVRLLVVNLLRLLILVLAVSGPLTGLASEQATRSASNTITAKPGESARISLNFQAIALRSVLQLLADYQGVNLVVSDSVQGELTLRLEDVTWQQALNLILRHSGLEMQRVDGVMLIAPQDEFARQAQHHREQAQLLAPLHSQVVTVHYARAQDMAAIIATDGNFGLLSERGSLSVDERTNALLVRDLAPNVADIARMVKALDVPVKQVQIEARIVSINEGDLDELGVRWGFHSSPAHGRIGASLEENLFAGAGLADESGDLALEDRLNVNLAATSLNASTIAFQVARLGSDTLLDLELSALQRESKAEIISSPRLITTNQQPAFIEQGTEIPYLESSSSGATSVAFKKAVLSLKVTPQITPDNRLVLDLNVTQDRPGEVVQTGTGEAVAINTQRIGTQVLVNDGETVVLGGIFQHSVTHTVDKVPLLGDLPWLGALFRRSYQQSGKGELLIFVTPKVVIQ
ncbi:type IV pilus secretin PilQ family protein [Vibrio ostreae]|uniref:Type IV pilus secretin PilQ family protein n=2 Tax=Vibrio ostreae TaxID=2841925 RepID=A0A975UAP4_9VIBR|nr:type IV pilus secretin PilQ family protein [Vibrio ostreae]QXO17631.1 type IV pilus secretin PilQ family protein [Vibrio ostreae]